MTYPIAETFHSVPDSAIVPSNTDKAFLAGVIEADGCISLNIGSNGYFQARIQVANTSNVLLGWIQARWQGKYNPNDNKSGCYTLAWQGCEKIREILEDILPYLVSKRQEGELLHEYARANNGKGVKSSISEERVIQIIAIIQRLHQGGRQ